MAKNKQMKLYEKKSNIMNEIYTCKRNQQPNSNEQISNLQICFFKSNEKLVVFVEYIEWAE